MVEPGHQDFEIKVDFAKGSTDPSHVFTAMAGLITSFQAFDRHLAKSISARIDPVVLLQDVTTGSLRAKLRTIIADLPDEALKEADWKKVVGHYLVKGKRKLLEYLADKKEITEPEQLVGLEKELHLLASETKLLQIPAYEPIPVADLVSDLAELARAVRALHENDKVALVLEEDEVPMNTRFSIPESALERLVTHEVLTGKMEMILRVKKPDYLGKSMWQFRHGGRVIEATIVHQEWLADFQSRKVEVGPGDSLRAIVETRVGYDRIGEVVLAHYEITRVLAVIRMSSDDQDPLPFDSSGRDA